LNKLKGRSVLRRGAIPPTFGLPYIPFNRAFPIYGAKQFKTGIVADCNCPLEDNSAATDIKIYEDPLFQDINDVVFKYGVGMFVYAYKENSKKNSKAEIIKDLGDTIFEIKFLDDGTTTIVSSLEIIQFFDCKCDTIDITEKSVSEIVASKVDY
jgi:hypothetical protein